MATIFLAVVKIEDTLLYHKKLNLGYINLMIHITTTGPITDSNGPHPGGTLSKFVV